MKPLDPAAPVLDGEMVVRLLEPIIPEKNKVEFAEKHDTDFAYEVPGLARFRANIFMDRKGKGAVFRVIPSKILTAEQLGLSQAILTLCKLHKGLVLVTGPTGSGKSTTLCAMIDHVNTTRNDHIITIEDPIEFVHENKSCAINQREVHNHTSSFKAALRAALREDPDIILVGELRDLETVAIAIETAETGHLVFGTLHTSSAAKTVDRIVDVFPAAEKEMVRAMLSESLIGVISQTLCKTKDGSGRVAAHEIMLGTAAIRNLIRESKIAQMYSAIQTGNAIGMQTLDQNLADLVRRNIVAPAEARAKAKFPENFPG
jgi:twitching motility protein PilT